MQATEKSPEMKSITMNDVQRLGDISKCPACGSEVDSGAYHCPKCRNYFCYRCRARVLPADPQFQCLNQECDYHGKLVCEACDLGVSHDEEPTVYFDRVGGWWPSLATCACVLFFVALFYTHAWIAFFLAAAALIAASFGLQRAGLNVFDTTKKVIEPRHSVHHHCIRCSKPAKPCR